MEKDDHSLSSKHHTSDDPQQSRSLSLRAMPSHDNHVTSVTAKSHEYQRATYNSLSNSSSGSASESHGNHMTSKPFVHENSQPSTFSYTTSFTRPSSSNSMYDSSRLHLTTSDYSSASNKSLPPFGMPQGLSSSSQQMSFTGYSSTHTASTGVSSGSGGAMTTYHAPPTISAPSSHVSHYPYYSKSVSSGKDSTSRPTSLSIGQSRGQGSTTISQHQQKVMNQQKFECPSCRKLFPYGQQNFEQWFEHIRYCENKPQ